MPEIKMIRCFQTSDNRIFVCEDEARERQAEIDICNLLDKKKFHVERGFVQPHELLHWIKMNQGLVREFLGKPKPKLP